MTTTPTETALGQAEVKYAAVIRKLDAIAEELVKAELWDEARIQTIAGLRYIYKDHVGTDKEAVDEYFETCSGHILHYFEEQPVDAIDEAKVWFAIEDNLCADAWHWYQGMMYEYECFSHYLPEGWAPVPSHLAKPQEGQALIDAIYENTRSLRHCDDAEELLELDVLGDDRELCGVALVMTGYLTNQENLTGDDLAVLQSYKLFSKVLKEALVDVEEG